MNDKPIAHTADGRPLFDNAPTVVVVRVPHMFHHRLLAVRRANDPGMGLLGLPGGYHMRGESWQEAGAREVLEETGYVIDPNDMYQHGFSTDEYGNNLLIASSGVPIAYRPEGMDGEALEVHWLTMAGRPSQWAFPRHYSVAQEYLS